MKKSLSLIFLMILLICQSSFAQSKQAKVNSISGWVKDNATQLAVPNADVVLSRLGLKAKTDAKGYFKMVIPAKSTLRLPDNIVVSRDKYWAKQVTVTSGKTADLPIALAASKQRLIVTTDIGGGDPDDEQSMVHLLVTANEIDIEGIICGLAWVNSNRIGLNLLNTIIDAYGESLPNLKAHAQGYPSVEYLKSIAKIGQTKARMAAVGEGKDSEGSELIIAAVDKDDPRPVWLNAWGGANTIAQAIWKVKNTRKPEEVEKFIQKIRVYDILGQDDAGAWLAKTFPDLIYIRNKAVYGWAPSDEWALENVQSRGPLGVKYRKRIWAIEGDSPAFFQLIPNGLSDPNAIEQGNWGGRFSLTKVPAIRSMDIAIKSGIDEPQYDPYLMYTNTEEGSGAINRWKKEIWNNLATRMKWSVESNYKNANHYPTALVNGDATKQVLEYQVKTNSVIKLDASKSTDPDGNKLSYKWFLYKEPSAYNGNVAIANAESANAQVTIPSDASGKTLHIILEVSDDGAPSLTAYRRILLKVQ